MITAIDNATKSFCTDIIGMEIQDAKSLGKNFYGAAIALFEDEKETQWYLLFKRNTLNVFSKALLFEENLQEDELNDLVKEVANMIIGSAKVELENKNKNSTYKLSTPDFLGHVPSARLLKLEEFLLYKIKNRTFVVGRT
jgi:chemotaxis protein CheY-P-specific phosphatase CheC